MTEQYLANDCTKCKREFNYLEHKHDTCIDCTPYCGDCLIPLSTCQHAKEYNR